MTLFSVKLPEDVYRNRQPQRDYGEIVRVRRAVVEAPSAAAALTTVLKAQRHPSRATTGLVFYGDLKENISDYVKKAPDGSKPDYVFRGSGGDTAQFSPRAVASSRGEAYSGDPVRPLHPDTIRIFPEARQVARALSDKPLAPEEEDRRARIVQGIGDFTAAQHRKGFYTQGQIDAAKVDAIKAARERQASMPVRPKIDLYPTDAAPPAKPKPAQGSLFDVWG